VSYFRGPSLVIRHTPGQGIPRAILHMTKAQRQAAQVKSVLAQQRNHDSGRADARLRRF
jgi:hypothetical protein